MNTEILYKANISNNDIPGIIKGYAGIFDHVDSHGDEIARYAFANSIKSKSLSDIKLLWQHDQEKPIGKLTKLIENHIGLYFEAEILLDLPQAKEAYKLIKSGVIDGVSIGFNAKSSYYDNKHKKRIITEIDLFEISLVTFPANNMARILEVKSDDTNNLAMSIDRLYQLIF